MKTEFGGDTYELNKGYTVGGYLDALESAADEARDETLYDEADEQAQEAPEDEEPENVLDSDYNPFDDERTARPSVMGYLLGREARGSERARRLRTGAGKKRAQKARAQKGFFALDGAEKVAVILGLVTVIIAVSVGTVYAYARSADRYLEEFAQIGADLEGVTTLGGAGLVAVADAQLSKQLAAEQAMIEAAAAAEAEAKAREQEAEAEQEEASDEVAVIMTLTTVQSDLKMKFINYDTDRRVRGVPFEVVVTGSDGSENVHNDHDKDGIIYLKSLKSGTYKVRMRTLPDAYAQYRISTETLSIKIKETIEYKGIDIVDEIKTESEVNVAKEDHKKADTPVESQNQDTVEWVESTKKEVDPGAPNAVTEGNTEYRRIEKSSITDPFTTGSVQGAFLNLSARSARAEDSVAVAVDEVDDIRPDDVTDASTSTTDVTEHTRDDDTSESAGASTATTQEPQYRIRLDKTEITLKEGSTAEVNVSFSPSGGSPAPSATHEDASVATAELVDDDTKVRITARGEGSTDIRLSYAGERTYLRVTVRNEEEPVAASIDVSPDTATIMLGETITLAANLTGVSDKGVLWSVTDGNNIVSVDDKGRVTGKKKGDATVRVTSKEKTELFDECWITVTVDEARMNELLTDREGRDVYVEEGSSYRLATAADYNKADAFYILVSTQKAFIYTGWQTLDGKTYYFDRDGNRVTGEQVINGAKYSFSEEGVLSSASGTLGIDVSKWNGNIDWQAVRNSGVSYVIIRCGYRGMDTGALIEDPRFRDNIRGASAAGLKVGAYFYSQAINEIEAVEEASMAISLCSNYRLTYPIFLDVETGGRANGIGVDMRTRVCKAFCATVANAGYKAGIYANESWLNSYINTQELTGYKIWLAQYAASATYKRTRYDMWQYTSKGRISGISGNVDMNISYLGY